MACTASWEGDGGLTAMAVDPKQVGERGRSVQAAAMLLETERLTLRWFTLDDLDDYYRLGASTEVTRYTGDQPFADREEARRVLLAAPLRDYELYGYGRLACFEKGSGRLIGFNGLKYLPELDEVDIGYRFFQDCWGKGYATESSRAVMKWGYEALGLERIVAIVDPDNRASVRVIEKLGLVFEKKIQLDAVGEVDLYAPDPARVPRSRASTR